MIYVSRPTRKQEKDIVKNYLRAQALLKEASDVMEAAGDTLIAAHIATPLALVEARLYPQGGLMDRNSPGRE